MWRKLEICLWILGLVLLGGWGLAIAQGYVASARDAAAFPEAQVDTTEWAESRRLKYRQALDDKGDLPLGVLRIPSINLSVPIRNGIDEWTLNRSVGRIPGTAPIGLPGNLAIAGHRDGFFRRLRHLKVGDKLTVQTGSKTIAYTVSDLWVVDPAAVEVLEPTENPVLTLVTCYPFYFVGHAPQRYIVRAQLDEPSGNTDS